MNPAQVVVHSSQIDHVAVAVCRTSHGNTHTGVAYRHSDGTVRFFHQAWHHCTRDEPLASESIMTGGPFFCVTPPMEPDRAKATAGWWEFIASRKEPIGYALRDDPEALFDLGTGLLALPNGVGLSCSTFVLVLFRSVRFPFINTEGWPTGRPGDREAQDQLLQVLEKTCPDRSHIDEVRREIGCERVRPEEVAGAALYAAPALPVRYPEAENAGRYILGGICLLGHFRTGMD